jgi:predicted ribosome quality control (RQC) complex YloA/Tae2 family protein
LEKLEQSGMDRVFTMTFGQGEAQYNLVVELYAAGNIVLTDKDYNILSLLRSYKLKDETIVSVGNVYPHEEARQIQKITTERVKTTLQAAGAKALKNGLDFGIYPAVLY